MPDLVPQPFETLLRRAAFDLAHGRLYGLSGRHFASAPQVDVGVAFHGEHAGTPLGPAAGPHTQLAQNIAQAYLAGARILELKTVQVKDELRLPRPCIDAQNIGFNVEWSQELKLEQSRAEYVKAWVLLHALRQAKLGLGLDGPFGEVLFDMSVGYDLAGIRSPAVRAFIDGMLDARRDIDALFDRWPRELFGYRPERAAVADRVSSCITLSTFHGCPADEIERIALHLLEDVGAHVVVKMNPTLLGFDEVCELLQQRLGYRELRPHRPAFDEDLKWDEALALCRRLSKKAEGLGLTFGAKFSNTLVVENHKTFFPATEKVMYLSGQPLHVLTFELCRRFREALGEPLLISFSAGVDAQNFADCVAAGFLPVTTCTDLLRPQGYGRLPRYLAALVERMQAASAKTLDEFILAESPGAKGLHQAALANHARAALAALEEPRYRAEKNRAVPRRLGTRLWLFDCVSCDKCVPVCPNDANFTLEVPEPLTAEVKVPDLVLRGGQVVEDGLRAFRLERRHQLANFADFCNECGNCDVFCPEEGGPYLVKPRFYSSLEVLGAAPAHREGFVARKNGERLALEGTHDGARVSLEVDRALGAAVFDDGHFTVTLGYPGFERRRVKPRAGVAEGHRLRLDVAVAMAALVEGVFAPGASSWLSAPFLPARGPEAAKVHTDGA